MQALGCPGVVSCPLELVCYRMLGLVFSRTASSVVSQTLPEYLIDAQYAYKKEIFKRYQYICFDEAGKRYDRPLGYRISASEYRIGSKFRKEGFHCDLLE